MIYGELKTSMPFYDSIEKQNRYKSHCVSICEFKLLYPVGLVPSFQFDIPPGSINGVRHWYIRCKEDDSIIIDLKTYNDGINSWISNLYLYEYFTDNWLCSFNGTNAFPSLPVNLSCGDYYMEIDFVDAGNPDIYDPTTDIKYFSEIFTVTNAFSDISFTQSEFPLPNLWRWYDSELKTNANKSHCAAICDYCLLCGNTSLLPFQFRIPDNEFSASNEIISWELIASDGSCAAILDKSLISIDGKQQNGKDYLYFTYLGDVLENIPCGKYYSKIVFRMNFEESMPTYIDFEFYSEPLCITADINASSTNYILQETGFKILLENGFGLLQE